MSSKCHWEAVYRGRATEDLGWYEPEPPTLDLVVRFAGATDAVIDIGGGDSRLLDEMSDAGYQHITVLDLSETALDPARPRLGPAAADVTWMLDRKRVESVGDGLCVDPELVGDIGKRCVELGCLIEDVSVPCGPFVMARDTVSAVALELHDEIVRSMIEEHNGFVFSTAGDAFSAAFARAEDAVDTARRTQEALGSASWPADSVIRVRMGVHSGEAQERDGDYFGPVLNRAARIMSAGHGGQVLVSSSTAAIVGHDDLVELGEHRLKDLGTSERLFQAGDAVFPALRSLEAVRHNLPVDCTPLIGRSDEIDQVRELIAQHRLVTLLGIGGTGKPRLATGCGSSTSYPSPDPIELRRRSRRPSGCRSRAPI